MSPAAYCGGLGVADDGSNLRRHSVTLFFVGRGFIIEAVDSDGQNGDEGNDDDDFAQSKSSDVRKGREGALANDLQIF